MKRDVKSKFGWIVLAAVIICLVVVRFVILPAWIEKDIKQNVSSIDEYTINYKDLSLSVFNASYYLNNVTVTKEGLAMPFFEAESVHFGFDFASILKGSYVGEVNIVNPTVNFIKGVDAKSSQVGISSGWIESFKAFSKLPVNEIRISGGRINYHDTNVSPNIVLGMSEIDLFARNLQNVDEEEKILSGFAEASGKILDATLHVDIELNSFYKAPTFKLDAELLELNLSDLKDFLKAYGNIDLQQGLFSLYTQAATKDNKIVGVIKPLIEDITMASYDNKDPDILSKPSSSSGIPVWTVKASPRGKVNEFQFEGNLDDPDLNLWSAIGMTLHNAFVEALLTTLEKSGSSPGSSPGIKPRTNSSKVLQKTAEKKQSFFSRIIQRKEAL